MSHSIVGSDWAQVEIINLVNDGTGLGFGKYFNQPINLVCISILYKEYSLVCCVVGIIGARTSGVIVKTILAGGVADRDGRLKSGDHILQIGDVSLLL